MESITINAYVLSSHQYGESDLIVSLFSLERGKIRAIAKGAKRSQKRFVNVLEPFSLIRAEIIIPRHSGLYFLKSAELIKSFALLAQDPLKFTHASLSIELIELWFKEEDKNTQVFTLLGWFLSNLECNISDFDWARLSLFSQTKILVFSGYYPTNIKKCLECPNANQGISTKALIFEDCNFCYNRQGSKISIGSLRTLLKIADWDIEQLLRIQMSKQIMLESWLLVVELHIKHLDKVPHSYDILKRLDLFLAKVLKIIIK